MSNEIPNFQNLNETELLNIIRRQTGVVVRRSVGRERLMQIAVEGKAPGADELAGTTGTRQELQVFIEKNWVWLNSQLPCSGNDRGKCTIYPCPEGRHLDCYLAAKRQNI